MDTRDLVGVNEDKLNLLVNEINDIVDDINKKFNTIESLVSETRSYFVCASGDSFRTKFSHFSSNFSVVNKNILNISYDLLNAKMRINNINDRVIDSVHESVGSIVSNTKEQYKKKDL